MARNRISLEREVKAISLYKQGMAIKDIIRETGIRSEQTIYRILDENRIPRRPKLKGARKVFVTLEEDVAIILKEQRCLSRYVNEAIRFFHQKGE